MNQRIARTILIAVGLAGLAVAILVFSNSQNRSENLQAHPAGPDLMIRGLKIRQTGDVQAQRPTTPPRVDGRTEIEFSSAAQKTTVDTQLESLDPAAAGWETEALADAAGRALAQIFDPDSDPADWPLGQPFSATELHPTTLTEVYEFGGVRVERASFDAGSDQPQPIDRGSFRNAMVSGHRKLKIVRIKQDADGFSTRVLAFVHTHTNGAQQTTSTFDCDWELPKEAGSLPLLRRLVLSSYERVSAEDGRPLFEDITASVLPDDIGPHDYPITHWAQTLTKIDDMHFLGHHGIAVGDADGDGLDDLYVCDGGGLPNRLYLQNHDGTVRDASAEAGINWLESSKSALFVDLDNDGDQDLVIATVALLLVMENEGGAKFSLSGGIPGMSNPHSLSAADYDLDGDLDLFVCNYGDDASAGGVRGSATSPPLPFNDAENGGRNALLKNDGELRFSDATDESGITDGGDRWSFAASWEDFDNDGDQDLYVANDFGRNNLFRNDGGRFTDVAATAGVEDISSGMSVSWADVNRDGQMDVYIGNMFSSAGGRVAFQRGFGKSGSGDVTDFQRMARGNTLFVATADGKFSDASLSAGVNMGLWAWGSLFADLNNDGWQDLVVANGYLTNQSGGTDL